MWYNSRRMDIVLFFQSTVRKSWRQKLAGVYAFAREHDWFVQVVDKYATVDDVRRAFAEWHPVGCLVDCAMRRGAPPDRIFKGIPTVYLDQNPAKPSRRHPCIVHDSAAEASLSGGELLKLGCASYAYVGTGEPFFWDGERLARFKDDAKAVGKTVVELPRSWLGGAIAALPKPCGILGANDECALRAFHAAVAAGLSVPDEVAVAGIDNDEMCCEAVSPGLTSAEPDFEGAGYRLAAMLEEEIALHGRLKGEKRGAVPVVKYGPVRLVRRGSTFLSAGQSPRVRRAMEHIRRHACEGAVSIDEVVAEMKCSRRLGTFMFKKETGRTILEEIHEQRFMKACDLLSRTNAPVSAVVAQCGYRSDSFVKRMFLRRTGMTMREYRKDTKRQSLV